MVERMKLTKGPNWKEIFIHHEWKNYVFWGIIMFLAGLTVRDVYNLV